MIEGEDYSLNKTVAMVYKLRVRQSSWADITIEEWQGGGSFKCISDYGDFSYAWTSIGSRCLREFLIGLNFDYFMGKATGNKHEEFDSERTMSGLRQEVLTMRKAKEISKEDAAECWFDLVIDGSMASASTANEFWRELNDTKIIDILYDGDPHGVCFCDKPSPQCKAFWEVIWPVAIHVWKGELNDTD